ncbi:MAG: hypothetical protein KDB18_12810 [Salinibacterium sp.]|nr:hypothetical protein [Salinibacterium sp.]
MNQVARVFVVINLLLSAGFLMAAATFLQQNEDWKQKWATAEEEKANEISIRDTTISEREGVINRMTDDVNRLKSEISKRDQSVTDLTARLEGSDQAKVAAEQIGQQLRGDVTTCTGELQELRNTVGGLENLIERYRERQEEAQAAAAAAEVARTEANKLAEERMETIHSLENEMALLNNTLSATNEQLQTYVAVYPPPRGIAQPKVDGQVVRYDRATGLAEINRGSDHGVKLGHEFDIVRGSGSGADFICTMRVDRVSAGTSVASIAIPTGRVPTAGDLATKLASVSIPR